MAMLTTAERNKLPSKSFALPGKGEGPKGKGAGSYPVPDEAHAKAALSRVSQFGTPEEKATVRAKVHAKYPSMGKGKKRMGDRMKKAMRDGRVSRQAMSKRGYDMDEE